MRLGASVQSKYIMFFVNMTESIANFLRDRENYYRDD